MILEEDFVNIGEPFSRHAMKARDITNMKIFLRFVQHAADDIRWTIDKTEFDELIALKKDSAPGLDGIPFGACKCAGWLGSQFLFNAHRAPLKGGSVPEHFAEKRTVSFPKTSDTDDFGRIIRSPDALRPLNCDCKLLTSPLVHHEAHTSLAEMHLFQTNDRQHL